MSEPSASTICGNPATSEELDEMRSDIQSIILDAVGPMSVLDLLAFDADYREITKSVEFPDGWSLMTTPSDPDSVYMGDDSGDGYCALDFLEVAVANLIEDYLIPNEGEELAGVTALKGAI